MQEETGQEEALTTPAEVIETQETEEDRQPIGEEEAPEATTEEAPAEEEEELSPVDEAFEKLAAAGYDEATLNRMADSINPTEPAPQATPDIDMNEATAGMLEEASSADKLRFQVISGQVNESIKQGNRQYQAMETEYEGNKAAITKMEAKREEGEGINEQQYRAMLGRQVLIENQSQQLNQWLDGQEMRRDGLRQLNEIVETHPLLKQFPSTYGELVRTGQIKPTDPPANQIRALRHKLHEAGVLKSAGVSRATKLPKSVSEKLRGMKTSLGGKTGSDIGRGSPTGNRGPRNKHITGNKARDNQIMDDARSIMRKEAMG